MMQRSKGDHDSFFGQLKAAHSTGDAFNTVAEYLVVWRHILAILSHSV